MLTVLLVVVWSVPVIPSQPTVCTRPGGPCYRPAELTTPAGTTFYSFQGITFGEAERFRLASKISPSSGTYDVSGESGVKCLQWNMDFSEVVGQEDCLLLNVYVPSEQCSH